MNPGHLRLQFLELQATKTGSYEGLGRGHIAVCVCASTCVCIVASNMDALKEKNLTRGSVDELNV